jgi:glycosyltransferase involved in cell wall biosynthesis
VKVSILCFDLSSNAAGRADLLARLLAPRYEVEVVGPTFGPAVWSPVRGGGIGYQSVPGARYPRFARVIPGLLRLADGDLLYASKPRPTSLGIGLLKHFTSGCPLLLDIDDWEVGFFYRAGLWGRVGRFLNLANPNGLPWTWLMERELRRVQGLTVASRFLQERFGGLLILHVRDTESWRPDTADPARARSRLGLARERIVMFLGTPRSYKGVDDLAEAVRQLGRHDVVLAVVGCPPASPTGRRLSAMGIAVRLMDEIPFAEVPHYLAAADLVAVPQRLTSDTVGQVPAKLFDAMALARPIISTRVSMIPEIIDGCGLVVSPGDPRELAQAVAFLLDHPDEARAMGLRARERCVQRYSYAAARELLFPLVERILRNGAEGRSA